MKEKSKDKKKKEKKKRKDKKKEKKVGEGIIYLTVGLGNTLSLILLLDGIGVAGALSSVHELISKTLSDGLNVTESSVTNTLGKEVKRLVDTTKRRNINSLTLDGTTSAYTSRIFTDASINNSINKNLDWVLISHEGNDLKSVLDDTNSKKLLTTVTTVEHKTVHKTLNNGALRLTETNLVVTTSSVRKIHTELVLLVASDVILKRDIAHVDIFISPLVEKTLLEFRNYCHSLLTNKKNKTKNKQKKKKK